MVALGVHHMVLKVLRPDGKERAHAHMKGYVKDLNALLLQLCHHLRCEMKTGCGAGH